MKAGNMEDELKKEAPELYKMRGQNDGFKTPDDYFDSFEDRIFARMESAGIQRNTLQAPVKRTARRVTMPQMLMAAAAVMSLLLAAVWFFKPTPAIEHPLASVELSEEEIETYLLENVQDFEAEQLAMLPDEEEQESIQPATKTPNKKSDDPLEDLSPEDVEHLLNDMTEEELEEIL